MANNSIIRRLARRWPTLLVLLLLGLAIIFGVHYFLGADRRAFANRLYIGFEKNVAVFPILAPLELRSNQAMALDIARSAPAVHERSLRILKGAETEADRAWVTGSNWTQAAWVDDYEAVALGADAWRVAVGRVLAKPDLSLPASLDRLRYWPPALLHFNRGRMYDRKFLARTVEQVERDAARVAKALPGQSPETRLSGAAALFEAGALFRDLPAGRKWRLTGEKALLEWLTARQKPDGSIGSLDQTAAAIEIIVPALALGYRAGLPLTGELSDRVQRLLEILMYSLDMNGCLPFAASAEDQVNRREWLFWGSRIFNRSDFAFVAYGGLDALEARPPAETSKAFPDLGLYVLRNNWEIRRYEYRGPRREGVPLISETSHTLWLDAPRGVLELFACGERQVRLTLPGPIQVTDWQVLEQAVILRGKLGKAQLTVVHPIKADAWVLRLDGLPENKGLDITSLRFPFRPAAGGGEITVPDLPKVRCEWITRLMMKPFGSVFLRTNGQIIRESDLALTILPATKGGGLTMALVGAYKPRSFMARLDSRELDKLAESRRVAFYGDECVLDARESSQSQPTPEYPWQPLRLLVRDGQVVLNGEPLFRSTEKP